MMTLDQRDDTIMIMKFYKMMGLTLVSAGLLISGLAPAITKAAPSEQDVLTHYAALAHAIYEDALISALALQRAVNTFIENPGENNLTATKNAWLAARVPYQQSEVYRFGNAIVDDWEGKVNAWPLDEGLLDYVDSSSYGIESEENPVYAANVIANTSIHVSGKTIDVSNITQELIADTLQELGGAESNVATGYHAIEFLLWGQDLNGTGPGAGERPASDYNTANCTHGHCGRRATYLKTATDLLGEDLRLIVAQWKPDGAATAALIDRGTEHGLSILFTGMGSLSYGELAGERMQLGLLLHDPEEEHDCFSDNTHASHYYDALGIQNIYHGYYQRIDGSVVEGPSVSELVAAANSEVDANLTFKLKQTMAAMMDLVHAAQGGEAYDQQIGEGNDAGNARVQAAIDALKDQAIAIENAREGLNLDAIEVEGADSLDDAEAVCE